MRTSIPSWIIWGIATIGCTALVSSASASLVKTSPHHPKKVDPQDCECFTVSGPDPGYFQHYKLWDFRAVPLKKHSDAYPLKPDDWNDWEDGFNEESDAEVEYKDDDVKDAGPSSLFFFRTAFDKDWISQQWRRSRTPKAPVSMINSKRNVFFTKDPDKPNSDATYLVLRTTRFENYTSTAEIETRVRNIYRCSLRVRLRIFPTSVLVTQPPQAEELSTVDPLRHPSPVLNNVSHSTNQTFVADDRPPPGACVGIFTYQARNCESDIEILTSDPSNRVRYANQPDYDPATDQMIPGASTVADLPVLWTTWSTHRLDWHSDRSRWYVDNILQEEKSYRVPNLQSRLVINLWSDGGAWTGDLKLGDSVYVGIEYIELAYNRSSDGSEGLSMPPSLRHGGHQLPLTNMSVADTGSAGDPDHAFSPATEVVTGAGKKKCAKGRRGRKCRKKQKDWDKDKKPGGHCRRPCNIDSLWFARPH